jgi:hypothetical protein
MEITQESLKTYYQGVDTHQLVALKARQGLTDLAMTVIDDELKSRGVTAENQSDILQRIVDGSAFASNERLASLASRVGAQLIDQFFGIALMLAVALIGGSDDFRLMGFCLLIAYFLLSDALPGGQSVGKKFLKIGVVDQLTEQPCTIGKSLLRNVTQILGIFDWVFIFGRKRQRLGDKIARTCVIKI